MCKETKNKIAGRLKSEVVNSLNPEMYMTTILKVSWASFEPLIDHWLGTTDIGETNSYKRVMLILDLESRITLLFLLSNTLYYKSILLIKCSNKQK